MKPIAESNATKFSAETCEHEYKETPTPNNYEYERYKCTKCGDTYKLYYDEMR